MTTAPSIVTQNCLSLLPTCCTDWVEQNPKVAVVTAVAFGALGIAAGAVAVMATVSLAQMLALGAVSTLSISTALFIAIVKQQSQPYRGVPPNISESDVQAQKAYRVEIMEETLSVLKKGQYRSPSDVQAQKAYRVEIMEETLSVLKKGQYRSPDGENHALDLKTAAQGAQLFRSAGASGKRSGTRATQISVQSKDCLYVAKELYDKGLNPLVLDMASDTHFGGGYREGARAQEEDLCRRTGLSLAVDTGLDLQTRNFYRLSRKSRNGGEAGVYVPEVPVFRAGYDTGYQYLNHPFPVAFGIVAAFRNPPLDHSSGSPCLASREECAMREKIRTLLEMAYQNGHRSLVLGALGCGAFGNPPDHVAELFMDVISDNYPGCFEEIVFAVLDDHNTGQAHNREGNFKPFARCILAAGGTAINGKGRRLTSA